MEGSASIYDQINTSASAPCPIFLHQDEDGDHLFFKCSFAEVFSESMFACTGSLSRTTSRKPVDDRKVNRFDIHNGGSPCAGSAHDGVEEDPMTKCTR